MITNKMLSKRTYWLNKNDITKIDMLSEKKGVSHSDIVRMAIKDYIRRNK